MSKPRRMELHRRQRRKQTLKVLRKHYQSATSESQKKEIFAKATRISPLITLEQLSG